MTVFSILNDLLESKTIAIFVISVHYLPNIVIFGSFKLNFGSGKELVTVFSFTSNLSESETNAIFVISVHYLPRNAIFREFGGNSGS